MVVLVGPPSADLSDSVVHASRNAAQVRVYASLRVRNNHSTSCFSHSVQIASNLQVVSSRANSILLGEDPYSQATELTDPAGPDSSSHSLLTATLPLKENMSKDRVNLNNLISAFWAYRLQIINRQGFEMSMSFGGEEDSHSQTLGTHHQPHRRVCGCPDQSTPEHLSLPQGIQ